MGYYGARFSADSSGGMLDVSSAVVAAIDTGKHAKSMMDTAGSATGYAAAVGWELNRDATIAALATTVEAANTAARDATKAAEAAQYAAEVAWSAGERVNWDIVYAAERVALNGAEIALAAARFVEAFAEQATTSDALDSALEDDTTDDLTTQLVDRSSAATKSFVEANKALDAAEEAFNKALGTAEDLGAVKSESEAAGETALVALVRFLVFAVACAVAWLISGRDAVSLVLALWVVSFLLPAIFKPADWAITALGWGVVNWFSEVWPSLFVRTRRLCLFDWEMVPGDDERRLRSYLRGRLGIDWAETAELSKIDDGEAIRLSSGDEWIVIRLGEEPDEATLRTSEGITHELVVARGSGCVRVCEEYLDYARALLRMKVIFVAAGASYVFIMLHSITTPDTTTAIMHPEVAAKLSHWAAGWAAGWGVVAIGWVIAAAGTILRTTGWEPVLDEDDTVGTGARAALVAAVSAAWLACWLALVAVSWDAPGAGMVAVAIAIWLARRSIVTVLLAVIAWLALGICVAVWAWIWLILATLVISLVIPLIISLGTPVFLLMMAAWIVARYKGRDPASYIWNLRDLRGVREAVAYAWDSGIADAMADAEAALEAGPLGATWMLGWNQELDFWDTVVVPWYDSARAALSAAWTAAVSTVRVSIVVAVVLACTIVSNVDGPAGVVGNIDWDEVASFKESILATLAGSVHGEDVVTAAVTAVRTATMNSVIAMGAACYVTYILFKGARDAAGSAAASEFDMLLAYKRILRLWQRTNEGS